MVKPNNLVKHLLSCTRSHGGLHPPIPPVDLPITAEIESPPSPPDIAPQGTTCAPMRRYRLPRYRTECPPLSCVRHVARSHELRRVAYGIPNPSTSRTVPMMFPSHAPSSHSVPVRSSAAVEILHGTRRSHHACVNLRGSE